MPELTPQSVAHAALLEITPEESIGDFVGSVDEGDGIHTVQFESSLAGYPGWKWTVSISVLDGLEPNVLETELIPGDGALLAPDWVPWSDRLADYKAAQAELEASAADADSDSDSDSDSDDADDDSDEDDDDDDLGSDVLHGGDLDGVDIDDADLDAESEDDSDESDESDESDDDDEDSEDDDSDEDGFDDDDADEGLREP